jgi:hypothetical protein
VAGAISALIAAAVAAYGNSKARQRWVEDAERTQQRWARDGERAIAARHAEWIREATSACLRAAQEHRSAILQGRASAQEGIEQWEALSRREAELVASEPDAEEEASRTASADDEYFNKNQARNNRLRTARSQAEKHLEGIVRERGELPARKDECLRRTEAIVYGATERSAVDWIQAKALAEVLAPELGEAIRRVERDLETLRGTAATPGRKLGSDIMKVDESFAAMLATARRKVEELLV